MKIIAFDPSLKQTGYAIIETIGLKIIKAGIIKTNANDEFIDRVLSIYNDTETLFNKCDFNIEHAVFEESFYAKNVVSSNKLAQVRVILMLVSKLHNCTISSFTPNSIKKCITGKGHATKTQVAYMVKKIFNIDKDIPDDVSDALAIAYTLISKDHL